MGPVSLEGSRVQNAAILDQGLIKQRQTGKTLQRTLSRFDGGGGPRHHRPCLRLNEKRRVTGGKRGQECWMYRKNITDN